MEALFIPLLQCTLSMSIVTLLYGLASPMLLKRYSPKWCYVVWLVIAVGWLIPFRPLIRLPVLSEQSANSPLLAVPSTFPPLMTSNPTDIWTAVPETSLQLSVWTIGFLIWSAGVVFMLVYHILRHRRFIKMVKRWSKPITAPETLQVLEMLKQEQRIKAPIQCKTCSGISSPMMIGFFHPVILMPSIQFSEKEFTLILRHELIHFKRRDLWCKAMVLAATILHWFNPVVYFMARAVSVQCEISCDALVLQNEDMQTRRQYGETVIAVVRGGRSQQTALSTNFYGGKRGLKKRILSMLDGKRKKAGAAVLCVVLAGIILTGATLVSKGAQTSFIPDTAFTEDEYAKLLALRFKNYKDMSVSEFQQKVWLATDTTEYMALLERFYEDVQLQEMKDTNDIATFLFYELIPLTSENWKTRFYNESHITNYEAADNARFEYHLALSILNADQLTVSEYDKTRISVIHELSEFFQERTADELKNEQSMKQTFDSEIKSLTQKWNSKSLSVSIEYFFMPLMPYDNNQMPPSGENTSMEERRYPNGTEETYRSLLKLKTANYQGRMLKDFNADILEWANEMDSDVLEGIYVDIAQNDFAVALKADELSFLKGTFTLSMNENAAMIRSQRTGDLEKDAVFFGTSLAKESAANDNAYCSLYYQMSYRIPDKSKITVDERDRCVSGVINSIQHFWDKTSLDALLSMSKENVIDNLQSFAEEYSNNLITIDFEPATEWFGFEQINEQTPKN